MFYHVRVELVSGFDGMLPETDPEADLVAAVRRLADDPRTAHELENEVCQRIEMLLCLRCRLELADRLMLYGSGGESHRPPGSLTQ
ncbi:MAG: hypothetical protein P9M14_01745 [Candidatus Alcyoniella australis]|nr:hypothetical protein [Candidatus Alcyoniella australis]